MRISLGYERKQITFKEACEKISHRMKDHGNVSPKGAPFPFRPDLVVHGCMMREEGWSEAKQEETPPVFWVYLQGGEVLKISKNNFMKVLCVPKSSKIIRLF